MRSLSRTRMRGPLVPAIGRDLTRSEWHALQIARYSTERTAVLRRRDEIPPRGDAELFNRLTLMARNFERWIAIHEYEQERERRIV